MLTQQYCLLCIVTIEGKQHYYGDKIFGTNVHASARSFNAGKQTVASGVLIHKLKREL